MIRKQFTSLAAVFGLAVMAAPGSTVALSGPQPSLIDLAVELNAPSSPVAGSFDTLLAAVLVASPQVLEKLSGYGQHTVFAPTDDAFSALGLDESNIGTLDEDVLTQILLYHIAQGRFNATNVTACDRIKMLFGGFLQQSGGVLTDNVAGQSTIIVTDQKAENGIIHAIDAVVLPFAI